MVAYILSLGAEDERAIAAVRGAYARRHDGQLGTGRGRAARGVHRSRRERDSRRIGGEDRRAARADRRRRERRAVGGRAEVQWAGGAGRGIDRNPIGRIRRVQAARPDGCVRDRVRGLGARAATSTAREARSRFDSTRRPARWWARPRRFSRNPGRGRRRDCVQPSHPPREYATCTSSSEARTRRKDRTSSCC